MACLDRLPDVLRASAMRRLPQACATRRRGDVCSGARRRANGHRDASRGAVACRTAWPAFDADDDAAGEGGS